MQVLDLVQLITVRLNSVGEETLKYFYNCHIAWRDEKLSHIIAIREAVKELDSLPENEGTGKIRDRSSVLIRKLGRTSPSRQWMICNSSVVRRCQIHKKYHMKTLEQIARDAESLDGIANIRAINKSFRDQDESELWPVLGKFNVTERAIRKARIFQRESGRVYGLEYCYLLDHLISKIVNSPTL